MKKQKPAPKKKAAKRKPAAKPAKLKKGDRFTLPGVNVVNVAKTKPAAKPAAAKRAQPAKRTSRTIDHKSAFLAAYSICASIRHAAKAAHVNRRRHYEWLAEQGSDYPARFKQARIEAVQSLEDEATYRAMVGVFEPNVYQGRWLYPQEEYEVEPKTRFKPAVMGWRDVPGSKPIGTWKKSDALIMFRLRGELPDKYRQYGSMELTGPGGGPIEIVERLNAARARVAALAAQNAQPAPAPDDGAAANYRH